MNLAHFYRAKCWRPRRHWPGNKAESLPPCRILEIDETVTHATAIWYPGCWDRSLCPPCVLTAGEFLQMIFFLAQSFWAYIISGQEAEKYFEFPCFGYFCDEHKRDASRRQLPFWLEWAEICEFGACSKFNGAMYIHRPRTILSAHAKSGK